MKRIVSYLKGVIAELAKVTWPTKKEATRLTIVVIVLSIIFGAFIGFLDILFTYLVRLIVS